VQIPLMPKGVEHCLLFGACLVRTKVQIPLMPKGVEHREIGKRNSRFKERANTSDAERR